MLENTDLICYCSLLKENTKQVLWHSLTGGRWWCVWLCTKY